MKWREPEKNGRYVYQYAINAEQMHNDGYVLYRSVNGVWLTKSVPVRYLEKE